ncbi:MAG: PTS transporter subunit EIIB [Holdemanella porci]
MAKIDYDNLTKQIVEYVGGVENIKTITHCVTRLRLYLNDRNKAEDEKIKNLLGVLGVWFMKSAVPDYSW